MNLHLRIFLASPGDVADERVLALRVLNRLPYDELLRGRITLEVVAWDHPGTSVPMLGGMSAQDSVILSRGKPSECQIVVVILWTRLGSPVADPKYAKPDGSGNYTGTEWEYEDAWQANRASSNGLPRLLLYKRTGKPKVELDPDDTEAIQQRCEQMRQVRAFFAACHQRDGSLPNPYQEPSDFERDFEQHLKAVIRQLMESAPPLPAVPAPAAPPPPLWKDSPFPGLRAFTPTDAPIFFGRGRETDGLVSRLADPLVRFLAVVGASGSGKSSLVAAGLIPRLVHVAGKSLDYSRHQGLPDVSPAERFSQGLVEELNEGQEALFQFCRRREATSFEPPPGQDAKPDFHLIQPRAMLRRINKVDAVAGVL